MGAGVCHGQHEYLALDHRRGHRDAAVRARQDLGPDGDVAKGIKAFKKGMAEDETPTGQAPAVPPPSAGEPVRTLPPQGEPATASHVTADRKVV